MTVDPYTVAALTLWALVAIVFAYLVGEERARKNAHLFDPEPLDDEQTTDQPDVIGQPRGGFYPLATQADYDALMADPAVPLPIKAVAGVIAHERGWCGCEPYDQDAVLTGDDLDWLKSQGGER